MPLQKLSTYIVGSRWGVQSANKTRNSINSLAGRRAETDLLVGVDRSTLYPSAGADVSFDHPNYWPAKIDWTEMMSGWTVVAVCYGVCENVADELTIRIRNITDGVNYDAPVVIQSVSWTEQVITIPPPAVAAVKEYRLAMLLDHASRGCNAFGRIISYA